MKLFRNSFERNIIPSGVTINNGTLQPCTGFGYPEAWSLSTGLSDGLQAKATYAVVGTNTGARGSHQVAGDFGPEKGSVADHVLLDIETTGGIHFILKYHFDGVSTSTLNLYKDAVSIATQVVSQEITWKSFLPIMWKLDCHATTGQFIVYFGDVDIIESGSGTALSATELTTGAEVLSVGLYGPLSYVDPLSKQVYSSRIDEVAINDDQGGIDDEVPDLIKAFPGFLQESSTAQPYQDFVNSTAGNYTQYNHKQTYLAPTDAADLNQTVAGNGSCYSNAVYIPVLDKYLVPKLSIDGKATAGAGVENGFSILNNDRNLSLDWENTAINKSLIDNLARSTQLSTNNGLNTDFISSTNEIVLTSHGLTDGTSTGRRGSRVAKIFPVSDLSTQLTNATTNTDNGLHFIIPHIASNVIYNAKRDRLYYAKITSSSTTDAYVSTELFELNPHTRVEASLGVIVTPTYGTQLFPRKAPIADPTSFEKFYSEVDPIPGETNIYNLMQYGYHTLHWSFLDDMLYGGTINGFGLGAQRQDKPLAINFSLDLVSNVFAKIEAFNKLWHGNNIKQTPIKASTESFDPVKKLAIGISHDGALQNNGYMRIAFIKDREAFTSMVQTTMWTASGGGTYQTNYHNRLMSLGFTVDNYTGNYISHELDVNSNNELDGPAASNPEHFRLSVVNWQTLETGVDATVNTAIGTESVNSASMANSIYAGHGQYVNHSRPRVCPKTGEYYHFDPYNSVMHVLTVSDDSKAGALQNKDVSKLQSLALGDDQQFRLAQFKTFEGEFDTFDGINVKLEKITGTANLGTDLRNNAGSGLILGPSTPLSFIPTDLTIPFLYKTGDVAFDSAENADLELYFNVV